MFFPSSTLKRSEQTEDCSESATDPQMVKDHPCDCLRVTTLFLRSAFCSFVGTLEQKSPRKNSISQLAIFEFNVSRSPVTMPPETISNDFGWFLELISRFEFEFCRCEIFFEGFKFLVCSKFNHTPCGLYMCMCCGLCVPTEFQFECCGVRDDS